MSVIISKLITKNTVLLNQIKLNSLKTYTIWILEMRLNIENNVVINENNYYIYNYIYIYICIYMYIYIVENHLKCIKDPIIMLMISIMYLIYELEIESP